MRTFEFFYEGNSGHYGDGRMTVTLRKVAMDLTTALRLATDHMSKVFGDAAAAYDLKSVTEVD